MKQTCIICKKHPAVICGYCKQAEESKARKEEQEKYQKLINKNFLTFGKTLSSIQRKKIAMSIRASERATVAKEIFSELDEHIAIFCDGKGFLWTQKPEEAKAVYERIRAKHTKGGSGNQELPCKYPCKDEELIRIDERERVLKEVELCLTKAEWKRLWEELEQAKK